MDWKKIFRGGLVATGGAFATWLSVVFIPALDGSGDATLLALGAFMSILVNVIRKALETKTDG